MKFNWYANCEQILKTHTLVNRNISQAHGLVDREQEIVFLTFLITIGKTREECFIEWKQITNGIAKIFENDGVESAYEFDLLYKNALSRPPLSPESKPVIIFTSEINALNSFQVPLWVKKYWLLALAWTKYQKVNGQKSNFNYPVRRWAMNIACPEYSYKRKSLLLHEYNKQSGMPLQNIIRGNSAKLIISFEQDKGESIFEFYSLDRIKDAFYLLEPEVRECKQCGEKFLVNSKTKRDVCETCFRLHREKRICPVCGKEFLANSKTQRNVCEECYKAERNKEAYVRVKKSRNRKKNSEIFNDTHQ